MGNRSLLLASDWLIYLFYPSKALLRFFILAIRCRVARDAQFGRSLDPFHAKIFSYDLKKDTIGKRQLNKRNLIRKND